MSDLIVLAITAPLTAAAFAAVARRSRLLQRLAGFAGSGSTLAIGYLLVLRTRDTIEVAALGGWPSRFAIVLVADPFASLLVAVAALLTIAVLVSAIAAGDDHHPFFHPLVLVLLSGVCGTFLTGDLFDLFVWFEVTLIASYILATLDGTAAQARAGAVYVATNLFGSLSVLVGVALTYAAVGSVNLAVLATELPAAGAPVLVPAALLLGAFAVKAALLPVGGWLAVTYPVAPRTIGALFAGLLTTVGVAALYRVALIVYDGHRALLAVVLVAACVTTVIAALAATGRRDTDGALAFLVIAQVGFMAVALGIGTAAAITAGVFFIVQDLFAKTAIYLAAASTRDHVGAVSPARLTRARPVLAGTFLVAAFSLAGVPPTSGFVGKTLILSAAFGDRRWVVAAAILSASLLTAVAAVGAWRRDFAAVRRLPPEAPAGPSPRRVRFGRTSPPVVLAGVVVTFGLLPAGAYGVVEAAADVLVDRSAYVEAVLR